METLLPGSQPAHAAIDMALHDIVGKALDTPVFNLIGGKVRERIALSYSIPFWYSRRDGGVCIGAGSGRVWYR